MNAAYPQPPMIDPMIARAKDESDLNLLSTLHYVYTALATCGGLGLAGYFIVLAAIVGNAPAHGSHAARDQEVAAGVMIVFGVVMAIIMIPIIVLHFLAAAGLKKRTRYVLVLVMSGWSCLHFPLGTALGVWSIIVLQRPGVKALFGK